MTTTKSNLSSSANKDVAKPKFSSIVLNNIWKNLSSLSVSQAGLVNNLVFDVTWGLFTIYFASIDFSVRDFTFEGTHLGIGAL